ncbi:HAMP domain-containing sensor histidine kinase [Balneolaceae bacterium ANBcel3]|nr:HAMP domain-containing sensor histidine kinase [Balneolaceae bacterium ANBcel3]
MKIRSKLGWTITVLLITTVTAGSAYAIFYIRAYLLEQAVIDVESDAYWMMHTLKFLPEGSGLQNELERVGKATDYHIALYDKNGEMIAAYPDGTQRSPHLHLRLDEIQQLAGNEQMIRTINNPDDEHIRVYATLDESRNPARFFVINQEKSLIFGPATKVRQIISLGLVISMIIILVFSAILAHYMARPLLKLTSDVERVAKGDTNHLIRVKRKDEIGILAESVNKMAHKLKADYEHLQKLNEKQSQFFADITHEVRNPLHTIMGSLEMLELTNLDDEKRLKYVKNVRSQAQRIDRLFKDLMTLQRFDSDENFIMFEEVDLAVVTENIKEWYRPAAKQKNIELKADTHRCMVYADPDKIEQVLDNLVSNAIKFTNKGSITLSYQKVDGKVEVSVSDTGIGIPEAHWPRLFDRFYRTDKARSRDKGGTGLGLSVVKGILIAHGSDVHVNSDVGRGSRFFFYLDPVPEAVGEREQEA